MCRMSFSLSCSRSVPSNTALPEMTAPGVSPSRVCVRTVLPLPDSPTMPSVRPASTSKDTPRTALTTPSAVGKLTVRFLTSSRATAFPPVRARRMLRGRRDIGPWLPSCGSGWDFTPYPSQTRVGGYPGSAVGQPECGDVGGADVRREDRRRVRLAVGPDAPDPRAGVIREALGHDRHDDRVRHDLHVGLVPVVPGGGQRGR